MINKLRHIRLMLLNQESRWISVNALSSLVIRFGALFISLIVTIIVARLTTPTQFGAYLYAFSLVNFLRLITVLGTDRLLIREIAAQKTKEAWGLIGGLRRWSILITLAVSIMVGLLVWAVTQISPNIVEPNLIGTVRLVVWLLPLVTLLVVLQSYARGLGHIVASQIPGEILRPVLFIGIVIFIEVFMPESLDSRGLIMFQAMATVVIILYMGLLIKKYTPMEVLRTDYQFESSAWIRVCIPLIGIALVNRGNAHVVNLLLGAMTNAESVALFGVAKRLSELCSFAQAAIVMPLAPTIARLYADNNRDELKKLGPLAAWGGTLLALPVAVLMFLYSDFVLSVFGDDYIEASVSLRILVVAQVATVTFGPVTVWLTMTKRESVALKGVGAGFIIIVALSFWLIPEYGVEGAAMASAAGLVATQIFLLFNVIRDVGINPTILTIRTFLGHNDAHNK